MNDSEGGPILKAEINQALLVGSLRVCLQQSKRPIVNCTASCSAIDVEFYDLVLYVIVLVYQKEGLSLYGQ